MRASLPPDPDYPGAGIDSFPPPQKSSGVGNGSEAGDGSEAVDAQAQETYRETFGTRFIVRCDDFKLRLQANMSDDPGEERLSNVSSRIECCLDSKSHRTVTVWLMRVDPPGNDMFCFLFFSLSRFTFPSPYSTPKKGRRFLKIFTSIQTGDERLVPLCFSFDGQFKI